MDRPTPQPDTGAQALCLLDTLPTELLQKSCSRLDYESLKSFSLASKRCRKAAIVYLFETVAINIATESHLEAEINQWITILKDLSSFVYVRTLQLDDGIIVADHPRPASYTRLYHRHQSETSKQATERAGDLRTWSEEHCRLMEDPAPKNVMTESHDWQPLIHFIKLLPALSHVLYNRADKIPQSLLAALQQVPQGCRLNMRSLHEYILSAGHIFQDSDLIISEILPMLTNFPLKFATTWLDKWVEINSPALLLLDKALQEAPLLEAVSVWWTSNARSPSCFEWTVVSSSELMNKPVADIASWAPRTTVHNFAIRYEHLCRECGADVFSYWQRRIDFTQLTTFKLEMMVDGRFLLPCLNSIGPLSSLKTLVLQFWDHRHDMDPTTRLADYNAVLSTFLRALKPLSRLRLSGSITEPVLEAITEQHGSSLRQLWLEDLNFDVDYTFDLKRVHQLCQTCNVVEDLRIPVCRSKGDITEVNIYKALGSISTMRRLYLDLYIRKPGASWEVLDPSFDDFHKQLYHPTSTTRAVNPARGHVRDLLINCTVDETLARGIFDTMCSNLVSVYCGLESLVLSVSPPWAAIYTNVGDANVQVACSMLGHSWAVTRDLRDTNHSNIIVMELCPMQAHGVSPSDFYKQDLIGPVITRIWPTTREADEPGQRSSQWTSFPLASLDDKQVA